MSLEEIIGQKHLKEQMVNFAKNNKMPHATLFLENGRLGALSMAIAMAKNILCKKPLEGQACSECQSCHMVAKYAHPDLHFTFPVIKKGSKKREDTVSDDFILEWRQFLGGEMNYASVELWLNSIKADSKQANINTRECVELVKKLSLKPFLDGAKVMIVWLPEFLGNNANRLLKLVEEPPENTYIIFASSNEEAIMGTLKSRCQILRLSPISELEMTDFVQREFSLDKEKAIMVAMGAESDLEVARKLATSDIDGVVEEILQWFRLCFMQKPDLLTQWIDNFTSQSKTYQKHFLKQGLNILRTFVQMDAGQLLSKNVTKSDFEKLKGLSNVLNFNKIRSIALILSEGISFVPRNINMRIMMMADSLTIGEILRRKD